MNQNDARFFMVAIRATTENKLSNTREQGAYAEKTTYRLPSAIRHRLKSWRVKRRYHFQRFGGIHWKTLRVWFFPVSGRPELEKWLNDYRTEYYEICRDIPSESDRREFEFSVEYGEFLPIQPESSRIIARMIQETIEQIGHDVDRLRDDMDSFPSYLESVKRNEARITHMISGSDTFGSVLSWSRDSIMLFANILALPTRAGLDGSVCRGLKKNIAKLNTIVSPLDRRFKDVLDLAFDHLNQTESTERRRCVKN